MSAAYYLIRLGYGVTVFEAMPIPGGMMAIGIPEYRLPRETLQAEIERIVGLGVELRLDAVMGRDFTLSGLEQEGFKAIFLATGAPRAGASACQAMDRAGVVPATVFLKQVNLGERPRLSGPVVVVGGGSTAMDAARSALRSGAETVTVMYRRGFAEMPAQAEEVEAARAEGVAFRIGAVVTEVLAPDGTTTGVRYAEQAPTGESQGGRAVWAAVPGSEATLAATTILVAVGEEPDPSILPEGAGIEVSAFAGIVADPRTLSTGHAGVFAGGDVVSGPKTIIDAVASGRRAAGAIHEYLAGARDGEAEIMATVRYQTPAETSLTLDLEPRARARQPLPIYEPGSFRAGQVGFDPTTAVAEASRCFRCDAVYGCPTVAVTAGRGPGDGPGRHPDRPFRRRRRRSPVQPRPRPRSRQQEEIDDARTGPGFFDFGEGFIEGTIGAALVALWMLALALFLARPYMAANTHKFTLRLGADLWWMIYVALRDILLLQVFLGSFIFFYPDVVSGKELPITGGLAAVCAFSVLLIKLIKGDRELDWYRAQVLLLGLGATLYILPYFLGVQVTSFAGDNDLANTLSSTLVSSNNVDVALYLCYLSAFLVGILAAVAVIYNFRQSAGHARLDQGTETAR